MLIFGSGKKKPSHLERLKKSEQHLKEYLTYDAIKKIESYEMLRKAIFRIQSIINNSSGIAYDKIELLNGDCLYADVYIIPYINSYNQLSYMRYSQSTALQLPKGEYEVLNYAMGKYSQDGIEKFSELIAINYSLENICKRWLDEISAIETAIAKAQKEQETED